jgi:hypothetical protein
VDATEHAEDWAPLLAMARLSARLAASTAPSADDPSLISAVGDVDSAVEGVLGAARASVAAEGGYPASAVASVGHLQVLVLPALCVCAQRWSALLPGAGKKKKKGEAEEGAAAGEAADSTRSARDALRDMLDRVHAALAELLTSVKEEGRRPAACMVLEQADEWDGFLGGGAKAAEARNALLDELSAASKANLDGFTNHLRERHGALKALIKVAA